MLNQLEKDILHWVIVFIPLGNMMQPIPITRISEVFNIPISDVVGILDTVGIIQTKDNNIGIKDDAVFNEDYIAFKIYDKDYLCGLCKLSNVAINIVIVNHDDEDESETKCVIWHMLP